MKVEIEKEYNNVAEIFMIILMYMYFLLKPFYLMKSGGMQISDIFLAGSFICFLVYRFQTKNFKIDKANKVFIVFALWACAVNGVYFLIHRHFDFIKSSLWYIFIAMFLLIVTECYQRKDVLKKIYNIMNINIIVQFVLWAFQIGKAYDEVRYMGSFNDPNQYGFFIFMTILFLYTLEKILSLKPTYISYAIALFLIYLSASTGSFIGIAIFLGLLLLINIKNIKKINFGFVKNLALKVKENRVPVAITSTFLLCFIFTSSLFINEVYGGMRNVLMKDDFTKRIVNKVDKVEKTAKESVDKTVLKIEQWNKEREQKKEQERIKREQEKQRKAQEKLKKEQEKQRKAQEKLQQKNDIPKENVQQSTVEKPVQEVKVEQPAVQKPAQEVKVEQPAVQKPAQEVKVEQPVVENPVQEVKVEQPVVENPVQEVEVEQPANKTKKDTDKSVVYSKANMFQERGYDKLLLYPTKMIYGAGQGLDSRFKTYLNTEFHATFPSILFYYGIVPLLIVLYWIYINIKNVKIDRMIVYIALFTESFILLNQRQPMFWFLILLGTLEVIKEENIEEVKDK